MQRARDYCPGYGTQPRDNLFGLVEPPHMGIAARQRAVWRGVCGAFVDRYKKLGDRCIELPLEHMRGADHRQMRTEPLARAEAQRVLDMRDRQVGLAGPQTKETADIPSAGGARVEREGALDQRDHGADILAELRQHKGGIGENRGVIARRFKRPSSQSYPVTTGGLRFIAPVIEVAPQMTHRGPGQRRPVIWIARDCLLKQSECLKDALLCQGIED